MMWAVHAILTAGLSLRRPGFNAGKVYVEFVATLWHLVRFISKFFLSNHPVVL
jgi:hypothetical protein